ncbi:MAG: hypothetical protein ABIH21_02990 [Patescibacteria group bacterium]
MRSWINKLFLFTFLFTPITSHADTYDFSAWTVSPVPYDMDPGESFTELVGFTVTPSPQPGRFMVDIRPSWGGMHTSSLIEFTSSTYYTASVSMTAPSSPGMYTFDIHVYIEFDTGDIINLPVWDEDFRVVDNGGGSTGDPEGDIELYDHEFDEGPYPVGVEVCGDIKLENNGDITYEIETVELYDSGADVDWDDYEESTNDDLDPGDRHWFGDPFCFTPEETGNACFEIDVEIYGTGWVTLNDDFCLRFIEADPCAVVTCSNTCQGDYRKYNGTPTPSGSSCPCTYSGSENCNNQDSTDSAVEYCSSGNVYSHQSRHDYSCRSATCTEVSTTWINNTIVSNCSYGCSSSGSDAWCNPSPCVGHSCPDKCDPGNVRKYSGSKYVCGSSCCCSYSSEDCDDRDTTPTTVLYCTSDGTEVRAHDQYRNYSCSSTSATCTYSTVTTNDRHIDDCPFGCSGNTCLSCTPSWSCSGFGTCQADGYRYQTCTDSNSCGTLSGKPAEREACPCILNSAVWSNLDINEGTIVHVVVQTSGLCDGLRADYQIIEDDGWLNPDDITVDHYFTMVQEENRIGWTSTHDPAELGDSEYYALVTLGSQEIRTSANMIVHELDVCEGATCEDGCEGNTRYYDGTPTENGGLCTCSYETRSCIWGCEMSGGDAVCMEDPCTGFSCPDLCNEYYRFFNGEIVREDGTCTCDYSDQSCRYGCYLDDGTALCADDPCILQSVWWMDNEVNEGTETEFVIETTGICSDQCLDYRIMEYDPLNSDDETVSDSYCLENGINRVSWVSTHDTSEIGNSEYYVELTMTDQEIQTEEMLIVVEYDSCYGRSCPDSCSGNTRYYNGHTVEYGGDCSCNYSTQVCSYECMMSGATSSCRTSPCEGVVCNDVCEENTRKFDGVPSVSGSECICIYSETDCDSMDTDPYTILTCSDDYRTALSITQRQTFYCDSSGVTCETAFEEISRETLATCSIGQACSFGECVGCTPEWRCGDWVCEGIEMFRDCWDINHCDSYEGLPDEEGVCPCSLEGVAWREDSLVSDGDTAHLEIDLAGDCYGQSLEWDLLEYDWNPGGSDSLLEFLARDDLELSGGMILTDYGPVTITWPARYDAIDYSYNEYYARVRVNGFEPMDSFNMLHVGPRVDQFGNVYSFLEENSPSAFDATVEDCIEMEDSRDLYACAERLAGLGEFIEFQTEPIADVLTKIADFVIGEENWEIALAIVCTICDTGAAHVGAVYVCGLGGLETSGVACIVVFVIDAATCGILCMDYVAGKVALVAGKTWRWVFRSGAAKHADELGAAGMRLVSEAVEDSGAALRYEDDAYRSYRVWASTSRGSSVHFAHMKNFIGDYEGGIEYLRAVNRFRRASGSPMIVRSRHFATSAPEDVEFLATLFQEEFFTETLEESFSQLANGEHMQDVLEEVRFVSYYVFDSGATASTSILGVTQRLRNGRNTIQLASNLHMDIHGEMARFVLTKHVLPHEIGHATVNRALSAKGYERAVDYMSNVKHRTAMEFFNDVRVKNKLFGEIQGDYYDALRMDIGNFYSFVPDGSEITNGRRYAQDFADATSVGDINSEEVWDFIKHKAYADEFGLTSLSHQMSVDLEDAMHGLDDMAKERVRVLLQQRSEALRHHAGVFADHVDDAGIHSELDHILCREYGIVAGCLSSSSMSSPIVSSMSTEEFLEERPIWASDLAIPFDDVADDDDTLVEKTCEFSSLSWTDTQQAQENEVRTLIIHSAYGTNCQNHCFDYEIRAEYDEFHEVVETDQICFSNPNIAVLTWFTHLPDDWCVADVNVFIQVADTQYVTQENVRVTGEPIRSEHYTCLINTNRSDENNPDLGCGCNSSNPTTPLFFAFLMLVALKLVQKQS